jgi:glutaredoxin
MINIYILEGCPYCMKALELLKIYKLKHTKFIVPNEEKIKNEYKKKHKMNTFPQIFIENKIRIGGFSDLENIINLCKNIKNMNISIDALCYLYKKIKVGEL